MLFNFAAHASASARSFAISSGVSFVDMLIIYIKKIVMKKQLMSKKLRRILRIIDILKQLVLLNLLM